MWQVSKPQGVFERNCESKLFVAAVRLIEVGQKDVLFIEEACPRFLYVPALVMAKQPLFQSIQVEFRLVNSVWPNEKRCRPQNVFHYSAKAAEVMCSQGLSGYCLCFLAAVDNSSFYVGSGKATFSLRRQKFSCLFCNMCYHLHPTFRSLQSCNQMTFLYISQEACLVS